MPWVEQARGQDRPPVAQLDRALPSGGKGQRFESSRAGHLKLQRPIYRSNAMFFTTTLRRFTPLLACLMLLPSLPAMVKTASAAQLEEVIVTARKREESLQRTPVSITALTAATIEQAALFDIKDIEALTPKPEFHRRCGRQHLHPASLYPRHRPVRFRGDHRPRRGRFTSTACIWRAALAQTWSFPMSREFPCCVAPRARCSARTPSAAPSMW